MISTIVKIGFILFLLQVGDQIIEINGYNTSNMTHAEAIDLIQNGGQSVKMLVKRTAKLPPHLGKRRTQRENNTRGVGLENRYPYIFPLALTFYFVRVF